MNPVETYLRRATRGLYGRKRTEARQELESHLFERTRQLMAAGLDEAQAQRQVLQELGEPAQVSAGLLQVHTLPLAVPALALALAAGGAGLMATQAAAQVRVPVTVYTAEGDGLFNPTAVYVGIQVLKTAFAKAGVQVSGPDGSPTLSASGLPIITLRLGQNGPKTYDPTQTGDLYRGFNFDTQHYQLYLNVVAVAELAAGQGWPVKISGWERPELTIGPARLALNGTRTAALLYTAEARDRLFAGLCALKAMPLPGVSVVSSGFGGISGYSAHTLTGTPALPGQIYAMAMPYDSEAPEAQKFNTYYVATAQAGPDGRLTFKLPAVARHLRFVTHLDATVADFRSFLGQTPTYQDAAARGTAVLFPLNGTISRDGGCQNALAPLDFTGTSDSP